MYMLILQHERMVMQVRRKMDGEVSRDLGWGGGGMKKVFALRGIKDGAEGD